MTNDEALLESMRAHREEVAEDPVCENISDTTHNEVLRFVSFAAQELGDKFPRGLASGSDFGNVDIYFEPGPRSCHLLVPNLRLTHNVRIYRDQDTDDWYAFDHNATPELFVERLRWLIGEEVGR